jgi:hypothetical protein
VNVLPREWWAQRTSSAMMMNRQRSWHRLLDVGRFGIILGQACACASYRTPLSAHRAAQQEASKRCARVQLLAAAPAIHFTTAHPSSSPTRPICSGPSGPGCRAELQAHAMWLPGTSCDTASRCPVDSNAQCLPTYDAVWGAWWFNAPGIMLHRACGRPLYS